MYADRNDLPRVLHLHRASLRPPYGGPSDVQGCGHRVSSGHDELAGERLPLHRLVDASLECLDHLTGDQRDPGFEFVTLVGIGSEIRTDHEEVSLQLEDDRGDRGGGSERSGQPQGRHGLVDAPIGFRGAIGLGDPPSVQKAGGSVVAGLRVDAHAARIPIGLALPDEDDPNRAHRQGECNSLVRSLRSRGRCSPGLHEPRVAHVPHVALVNRCATRYSSAHATGRGSSKAGRLTGARPPARSASLPIRTEWRLRMHFRSTLPERRGRRVISMTGRFGSVVTAMVTPFRDDFTLDLDGAQALATYLLDNGSDTVLVAGSTGEGQTVSHEEKDRLLRAVVEAANGRGKVWCNTR